MSTQDHKKCEVEGCVWRCNSSAADNTNHDTCGDGCGWSCANAPIPGVRAVPDIPTAAQAPPPETQQGAASAPSNSGAGRSDLPWQAIIPALILFAALVALLTFLLTRGEEAEPAPVADGISVTALVTDCAEVALYYEGQTDATIGIAAAHHTPHRTLKQLSLDHAVKAGRFSPGDEIGTWPYVPGSRFDITLEGGGNAMPPVLSFVETFSGTVDCPKLGYNIVEETNQHLRVLAGPYANVVVKHLAAIEVIQVGGDTFVANFESVTRPACTTTAFEVADADGVWLEGVDPRVTEITGIEDHILGATPCETDEASDPEAEESEQSNEDQNNGETVNSSSQDEDDDHAGHNNTAGRRGGHTDVPTDCGGGNVVWIEETDSDDMFYLDLVGSFVHVDVHFGGQDVPITWSDGSDHIRVPVARFGPGVYDVNGIVSEHGHQYTRHLCAVRLVSS